MFYVPNQHIRRHRLSTSWIPVSCWALNGKDHTTWLGSAEHVHPMKPKSDIVYTLLRELQRRGSTSRPIFFAEMDELPSGANIFEARLLDRNSRRDIFKWKIFSAVHKNTPKCHLISACIYYWNPYSVVSRNWIIFNMESWVRCQNVSECKTTFSSECCCHFWQ